MEKIYYMGIDVGATTIKIYIIDQDDNCVYSKYERHYSDIQATITMLIKEIKNKFGKIVSKENIDTYIPQFTSEKASNLAKEIREQSIDLADAKEGWEEYFTILKGRNQDYIVDLIKNTDDLSKLTGEDLSNANKKARESAIAHNNALKQQTIGAKAATVATKDLATFGNMLAMWAITKGIILYRHKELNCVLSNSLFVCKKKLHIKNYERS